MDIALSIIGALMAAVGGLLWMIIRGGSERRELERDIEAHERMNDADTGAGASDADNVDWLRDFSQRHRRR